MIVESYYFHLSHYAFSLEIDRYGFFVADTDILAIDGPIADTDVPQIFKSCFLFYYQKYFVFYTVPFLKNFKNQYL